MKLIPALAAAMILAVSVQAAPGPLQTRQWDAHWVDVPGADPQGYGVYLFRNAFDLAAVPPTLPVLVSADNRYKLYVNGELVSLGPARCDIEHWNYEEVDLAPLLHPGANVVSALVWNEGPSRAEAQFSLRTAFIMQGAAPQSEFLNTGTEGSGWKCLADKSSSVCNEGFVMGYFVAPPSEKTDMSLRVRGWQDVVFDDSAWQQPRRISRGTPKLTVGIDCGKTWRLVPSPLPQLERTPQRFASVRRSDNVIIASKHGSDPLRATSSWDSSITIPAGTKASFLLDQGTLTNAYPTFVFDGGKGAKVSIVYSEAPVGKDFRKGDRNEIEDKVFIGRTDVILPDGSASQEFTPLSFRTFRYIEVTVETGAQELFFSDIYSTFTGYPFELKASLRTDDKTLQDLLETGWRTARLCAVESYMDCPYYEQLQYGGDARIQEQVSLYNAGDPTLMRNLLNHLDQSRQSEGITQSRYPSVNPQIIPTYSMCYIWMLHDWMMYVDDPDFLRDKLPGARMIIDYFRHFQDGEGSLRDVPNWTFVDWVDSFERGKSPTGRDGSNAILDLHLLMTYRLAADIEAHFGLRELSERYLAEAEKLSGTIRRHYWDASKGLFADNSDLSSFSRHANALALLCGLADDSQALEIATRMQDDRSLTEESIYFKFYVHSAMARAGLADNYLSWLDIWRENLRLGMTTWAEKSDLATTRSECHAWGSSPNIELFRTVLGIDSAAPGFSEVVIAPALGELRRIGGTMPHPRGEISVDYELGRRLQARIVLPEGLGGTFVWKGETWPLEPGENTITVRQP